MESWDGNGVCASRLTNTFAMPVENKALCTHPTGADTGERSQCVLTELSAGTSLSTCEALIQIYSSTGQPGGKNRTPLEQFLKSNNLAFTLGCRDGACWSSHISRGWKKCSYTGNRAAINPGRSLSPCSLPCTFAIPERNILKNRQAFTQRQCTLLERNLLQCTTTLTIRSWLPQTL